MKEFTAKEARDMANKSGAVSRETRSILRSIKRAAKRGRYSLKLSYSEWDSVVAEKICENLKGRGYRAYADNWKSAIYISWQGEDE
jgi:hypothetical protein